MNAYHIFLAFVAAVGITGMGMAALELWRERQARRRAIEADLQWWDDLHAFTEAARADFNAAEDFAAWEQEFSA